MAFTEDQLRKLRAKVRKRFIRSRTVNGRTLSYVEGWHVVAEANRIFGFDGWDRETIEATCVWTKQSGDRFSAAYVTRVRIVVIAGDRRIVRDGTGVGESTAETPGQAHEIASKVAETDATKRAFITFGNPFGLSLYSDPKLATANAAMHPASEQPSQASETPSVDHHGAHMTNPNLSGDLSTPNGILHQGPLA